VFIYLYHFHHPRVLFVMAAATQQGSVSHGRGTAAEQGARIRAEMEQKRKSQQNRSSKIVDEKGWGVSFEEQQRQERRQKEQQERRKKEADERRQRQKAEDEKKAAEQAEKQRAADDVQNEKSSHATAHSPAETAVAGGTAAASTTPVKKPVRSGSDPTEPVYQKKGRCYPVTGIDNLALLMEDDSYQTTCFSTYLFKTEIDSETIHRFFRKLVSWYPKYHYVVELSAQEAAKKEKARKQAIAKGGEPPRTSETTEEDRRGRRTRYSKSLKAGGWYRPARWRYADGFEVDDNIVELDSVPAKYNGDGDEALYAIAGDFLSEHFDYSKPLWKALCVRGLNTSKGAKSALMIKVHHALSDGQGMIMSYHTALAALEQDAPIEEVQKHVDMRSKKGEQKKPGQRNIQPTLWGTTKHGFHTVRGLYFRRRKAFEYSGDRVPQRLYCHSDGIPMADIKMVRDAFSDAGLNLTLNDVACAVLSRALRMAAERTEPKGKVQDKRIAVFVPISKRPAGNWEMSNFTTGAIAWFAFNDPAKVPFKQQLAQVHREMNRIKRSHWPNIWYKLFGQVSKRRALFVPNYPIGRQFFEATYREYHVATNLPGPSKPVMFGEHEAFAYHVLPPSSPGKSSLAIGMISYANDFSLAVSCDGSAELKQRKLAPVICSAFQDAAQELVVAAKEERAKTSNQQASHEKSNS
jgi:hypothetical protein